MVTNKSNDSEKELKPLDIDMIDMEDAREGVQVTIPAYTNMKAGDTIQLYWDGYELEHNLHKDEINNEFSLEFTIPPQVIAANMGQTVQVSYQVTRGNREYSSEPLTLKVPVDLEGE
ncbi:hypothetical protein ACFVWC_18115 [Bacillus mycoides]|uniref:hypothetical protein n=1 Tax=Bacillus TaxID=1386 RepID=UPI00191161AA|nr:hypothetical protein [Bacillus sp. TH25]MBK5431804.1 hypothetical protein [Bacillus sp. TH25]